LKQLTWNQKLPFENQRFGFSESGFLESKVPVVFPKLKSQKRQNNPKNSARPLKKQLLHLQMRWRKFYLP
jgi:hypothetical protein